jgi:phosphoglycolate phosphatase-like HAD superfamily hydrolase
MEATVQRQPKPPNKLVFLLDVDNTLLDNDRSKADMQTALLKLLGEEGAERFWQLYEDVRKEIDVVSYPETLKRFAANWKDKRIAEKAAELINNWPYSDYLYPGTLAALEHLTEMGDLAILSDGDEDYQPRKIMNAGLTHAVGGPADVLIFTHKEHSLDDVTRVLPSRHYVLVDDKERILTGAKEHLGDRLTTVWVKQGHYATDPKQYRKPDPDIVLDNIAELCRLEEDDFGGKGGR